MPRVFTSSNDPLDFCRYCFPTERQALSKYGNVGDGPDGRGNCFAYDAEHPDYEGEGYVCYRCRHELDRTDNDADVQSH